MAQRALEPEDLSRLLVAAVLDRPNVAG